MEAIPRYQAKTYLFCNSRPYKLCTSFKLQAFVLSSSTGSGLYWSRAYPSFETSCIWTQVCFHSLDSIIIFLLCVFRSFNKTMFYSLITQTLVQVKGGPVSTAFLLAHSQMSKRGTSIQNCKTIIRFSSLKNSCVCPVYDVHSTVIQHHQPPDCYDNLNPSVQLCTRCSEHPGLTLAGVMQPGPGSL